MKLSKLVGERTKTTPSDATMKNHILLLRAGYMKQVAGGIYSLTTLGARACLNIENIIREEMDLLDGQEVKFPVVMPKELWDMSGRYSSIGSEMARFTDRTNRQMLLGMTHEEAAVHLAKNWVNTYTQLPCMIYQIQTKFRDEPRSRGGLIRVREFTMKDAYSFHMTEEDLNDYYYKMHEAYERIYNRIGIGKNVISVKSDNGMFGGKISHEFMYLNDYGEDQLVLCDKCGYHANQEVAECLYHNPVQEEMKPLEKVFTGEAKTIEQVSNMLKVSPQKCMKAVVYGVKGESGYVVCFIRGDREINETKLRHICQKEVVPYDATNDKNFCAGNIGAYNLNVENAVVFYDKSLEGLTNLVIGANEKEYHYINFNFDRDMKNVKFYDISKVKVGDPCAFCNSSLSISNGIEVGNIFQLGTKYTQSMGMEVTTKDGNKINPIMGCYGIGVGRALACIVEENSDDNGICLPMDIAPFKVHIVPLGKNNEEVTSKTFALYSTLQENKIPVLLDDRDCSNGIKFADADLIGMPIRVVVSPRSLAEGKMEIKLRKSGETFMVDCDKVLETLINFINTKE
jgi:prolyl-tRNA synthetase